MHPFIARLRGQQAALPARATTRQIALAATGGALAIGTVGALAAAAHQPLILGSFGASCVLLFGFPESPFSQPRNVVGGHVLSSLMGLLVLTVLGPHWWSMALATGAAMALMFATRTVHPPAGSNPVIIVLTQPGWSFVWQPTLAGAVALVALATIFLNLASSAPYPKYWIGGRAKL